MKPLKIWTAVNHERVLAGTSTRLGGQSLAPYHGLNLAFHTGDQAKDVIANRIAFSEFIQVPLEQMVFTYQSHSTILKKVTNLDQGKGLHRYEDGIPADALYTETRGVMLAIFHADCVPVFLIHQTRPLIAVIHAGTPGSLKKISLSSVKQLCEETGSSPKDFQAYLGPSLDFAHHPIDERRVKEVLTIDAQYQQIIKKIGGQHYLDIPLLNYLQLVDAGLNPTNIFVSNLDTFSNPETYFSYDRDHITGRHLSFVYLR
jgi:polyphenol oxidase